MIGQKFDIVGTARDGRTLVELAKSKRPDIIVTDITMPELNGLDAARIIRQDLPSVRFIFLTMHTDLPLVEEAFRVGATGYLLKLGDGDELLKAIQAVARGGTYITPRLAGDLISLLVSEGAQHSTKNAGLTLRQRQVLQLLAEGKTMKEVASQLAISTRTSESHKYEIMRQLGLKTSAELVRYAVRLKLV
jgi:DNA-binding NarL/FixJ family response regulator